MCLVESLVVFLALFLASFPGFDLAKTQSVCPNHEESDYAGNPVSCCVDPIPIQVIRGPYAGCVGKLTKLLDKLFCEVRICAPQNSAVSAAPVKLVYKNVQFVHV